MTEVFKIIKKDLKNSIEQSDELISEFPKG